MAGMSARLGQHAAAGSPVEAADDLVRLLDDRGLVRADRHHRRLEGRNAGKGQAQARAPHDRAGPIRRCRANEHVKARGDTRPMRPAKIHDGAIEPRATDYEVVTKKVAPVRRVTLPGVSSSIFTARAHQLRQGFGKSRRMHRRRRGGAGHPAQGVRGHRCRLSGPGRGVQQPTPRCDSPGPEGSGFTRPGWSTRFVCTTLTF